MTDTANMKMKSRCADAACGPAAHDRREDLCGVASIDPLVIHQRWPDSSTALEVTARAVHLIVESLSLRKRIGVVAVRRHGALGDDGTPGLQITLAHDALRRSARWH